MATAEILPAFSYACGMISAKLSRGERVLLQDVSFSLSSGQRLAIIGETGSGKTMLALSILGLLPANVRMQSGCIEMDGAALPAGKQLQTLRGDKLVYIPQNGAEFLLPARTVRKQLYDSLKKLGLPRKDFPALAAEKLRLAGFDAPETLLDKYPFQLSGGMAQRVVMAMASAGQPGLVIADEPTKGIDRDNTALFLQNLDALFPGAAVLLITHDLSVASACERLLVMQDGRAVETGETQAVLAHPQHTFTRQLLDDLRENHTTSPIFTHHIAYVTRSYYPRVKPYADCDPNQIVVDYIASMTDDYFIDLHHYLFPNSPYKVVYKGYFDGREAPAHV